MPSRDFDYSNPFDGSGENLSSGTVSVTDHYADTSNPGVSGGVLHLFSITQPTNNNSYEGAILGVDPDLAQLSYGQERVQEFSASMRVGMVEKSSAVSGGSGNRQPDGVSFSFGDLSTYPADSGTNYVNYEKGPTEGLSIRIIPYASGIYGRGTLSISWNGTQIASTSFTGSPSYDSSAVDGAFGNFSIAVSPTGAVTASFKNATVTGTIPGGQWGSVDQSGWQFAVAGRSGSNGGIGQVDDVSINSTIIPCFTRGTLIETIDGPMAVESLRSGDLVLTKDNGYKPIVWIGSKKMARAVLAQRPHLQPVRIEAGAFAPSVPEVDLLVSPQHRVLVSSSIAQRMFGTPEVLVAAKQLLALNGVDMASDVEEVEYFHFLFDEHEVVRANGAWAESLYLGAEALKAVGPAARKELLEIFPEIEDIDFKAAAARLIASGKRARRLAERHAKNAMPLSKASV